MQPTSNPPETSRCVRRGSSAISATSASETPWQPPRLSRRRLLRQRGMWMQEIKCFLRCEAAASFCMPKALHVASASRMCGQVALGDSCPSSSAALACSGCQQRRPPALPPRCRELCRCSRSGPKPLAGPDPRFLGTGARLQLTRGAKAQLQRQRQPRPRPSWCRHRQRRRALAGGWLAPPAARAWAGQRARAGCRAGNRCCARRLPA